MSYRKKIRDVLLAAAEVSAVVDSRIYALRAPATAAAPYILLTVVSHFETNTLRGRTNLENARIRCDLYGQSYNELVQLSEAVKAAMDGADDFSSVYVFGTDLYEDDTKLYHVVLDFSVWNDR